MAGLIGAAFILTAFVFIFSPKAAAKLLMPVIGVILVIWFLGLALDAVAFRPDGSPGKLLILLLVLSPAAYAIRKARHKQHGPAPKAVERIPLMPSHSEVENHETDSVDVGQSSQ